MDIQKDLEAGLSVVKTEVNAALETKANSADVTVQIADATAVVTKETKEVIAKQDETITTLKGDIEGLTAKLTDLSTVSKEADAVDYTFTKQDNDSDGIVVKQYDDNTAVDGGRVDHMGPVVHLEAGNFMRTYGDVWATTSGSVTIPVLSNIAFTKEGTVNSSRTKGGTLAVSTGVVDNYVSENPISKPAVEDIPMFDAKMTQAMMIAAGKAEGVDAVAALKAASFTEVKTGLAAALPSKENVIAKLAAMKAALDQGYMPNAKFYFSPEFMALVEESNLGTGGALNFNPVTGLTNLWGYDVVRVQHLESGAVAGHFAAYFGDMTAAASFVVRKNLEIGRWDQTSPGHVTYFGDLRSVTVIVDTTALVGLKTAA